MTADPELVTKLLGLASGCERVAEAVEELNELRRGGGGAAAPNRLSPVPAPVPVPIPVPVPVPRPTQHRWLSTPTVLAVLSLLGLKLS
jgi:hypothetical protein